MDLAYDQKFEEMKKYIPFLENMIKRLESTGSATTNPRQAQLDKIRSLRDLLLDKKKRMKMENLLKCEQVLVNLYAKVEQRDALPNTKNTPEEVPTQSQKTSVSKENSDLNDSRNKLKAITLKTRNNIESLPEIAGPSNIELICSPGSKEPALFQRRPNKITVSPPKHKLNKSREQSMDTSSSRRNYTRVLVSPEPSSRRWNKNEDNPTDKLLFTRRSPWRSPRRHSPSHYKKEKKKSVKQKTQSSSKVKDLNITLNVPEECLNSLNTEDILSRIINCSDNDVDIETLRELRTQILGELKQTGGNDDISDLILKSYKNKKKDVKDKEDVEEGELSDSESETIESIYGSLVILEKEKNKASTSGHVKTSSEKDKQPRKIQICLVINSDKDDQSSNTSGSKDVKQDPTNDVDITDFEMYEKNDKDKSDEITSVTNEKEVSNSDEKSDIESQIKPDEGNCIKNKNKVVIEKKEITASKVIEEVDDENENLNGNKLNEVESSQKKNEETPLNVPFKANFYKPLSDQQQENQSIQNSTICQQKSEKNKSSYPDTQVSNESLEIQKKSNDVSKETHEKDVEIPLLNLEPVITSTPSKKNEVSEIDILQALKNEILSESITILGADVVTPPLHQPKLTKVANTQETMCKKRISIEKYKEKTVCSSKTLNMKELNASSSKDDYSKKQSLKLTEKECERFNFPVKLALDESSDEEDKDKSSLSLDDIYDNLAPKSPDHDSLTDIGTASPVIIPVDPVKTTVVTAKTDIDMRKLIPMLSPNIIKPLTCLSSVVSPLINNESPLEVPRNDAKSNDKTRPSLVDPRIRREINQPVSESPNPYILNSERTPLLAPSIVNFSNMTPNMTPSMTPNVRSYEMSSHQLFEIEEHKNKHVYAPVYPSFEPRDNKDKSSNIETRNPGWDSPDAVREDRMSRWDISEANNVNQPWNRDDRDSINSSIQRDEGPEYHRPRYNDSFNYENSQNRPRNDRYSMDQRDDFFYSRSDCPQTPSHPFGRSDCPATPSHSFGRLETPVLPFVRSECPPTPTHHFGRHEMPMTPSHSFGRADYSHNQNSIGQNFGNSGGYTQDLRFNRNSDYDSCVQNYDEERERVYYNRNSSRYQHGNSYKSEIHNRSYNSDSYRHYGREQSINRNDRHKFYSHDGRQFNKDTMLQRDSSVGRSLSKEYETDRYYTKDHNLPGGSDYRYDMDNIRSFNEVGARRNFQRERNEKQTMFADEQFSRSRSRAASVGRNNKEELKGDNTLSVKPHAGRSFTIDTSVNRTFQEVIVNNKSFFDNRRQRAASVGRSLVRESSKDRSETQISKCIYYSNDKNKNNKFRRACSVGRDIVDSKENLKDSFKDVKAAFKAFQTKINNDQENNTNKESNVESKSNENTSSRKDKYNMKRDKKCHSLKQPYYSPRKNQRDPRLRREHESNNKYKDDRTRRDSREKNTYGIVYSNDNIAKGTILGSGYGVKNYKIPKIKRAAEEKEETTSEPNEKNNEDSISETDKKDKRDVCEKDKESKLDFSEKAKEIELDVSERVKEEKVPVSQKQKENSVQNELKQFDEGKSNLVVDNIERRVTRSSKKFDVVETKLSKNETPIKTRKTKKLITSESDDSTKVEELISMEPEKTSIEISKKQLKEKDNKSLNSNLAIDVEIFSDNVTTDPVIDNINDLIADLDKDLNTSKTDESNKQLIKEISTENIVDDISSSEKDSLQQPTTDNISEVTKDIKDNNRKKTWDEVYEKEETISNLNGSVETGSLKIEQLDKERANMTNKEMILIKTEAQNSLNDKTQHSEIVIYEDLPVKNAKEDNEAIASTTDTEGKLSTLVEDKLDNQCMSTPDSTNNSEEMVQDDPFHEEGLPDSSTNEMQKEMKSDISTTQDLADTKEIVEPSSSRKEITPQMESIGCLLSILQDKSKIKELLNMLGDQSSENEKIKKKLEKLSEIVSDDEDTKEEKVDEQEITLDRCKTDSFKNVDQKEPIVIKENPDSNVKMNKDDENLEEKSETERERENKTEDLIEEKSVDACENKTEDLTKEITIEKCENKTEKLIEGKLVEVHENKMDDSIVSEVQTETETDCDVSKKKSSKKMPVKKGKTKKAKGKAMKNLADNKEKRLTRSDAVNLQTDKPVIKKPSRELKKLQDDIREMFISEDILNATGIRMCRLAKLAEGKNSNQKEEIISNQKEEAQVEADPVVLLEKCKNKDAYDEPIAVEKPIRKKPAPKSKSKAVVKDNPITTVTNPSVGEKIAKPLPKYKPGPKSKTKSNQKQEESDPYAFESDSISDINTTKASETSPFISDSENESLDSSKSFGSSELLVELKKNTKRKRRKWQAGIIKAKTKKKKINQKHSDTSLDDSTISPQEQTNVPDMNCFTDKSYCFLKNVDIYPCRLCTYNGPDIVHHYKKDHPHTEIPLSRMSPEIAKETIEQCVDINFQAVSKISSDKYICRFCHKEFGRKRNVLETFFWHVVSTHTGEYKQLCSECINVTPCPFSLDIPPPPKDLKGQLIGYICEKCNFTQVSLENLKTHVSIRHNDEETGVYTINLAVMSKKTMNILSKKLNSSDEPRMLRSTRANKSITEVSDDHSDITDDHSDRINESEMPRRLSARNNDKSVDEVTPRVRVQSKLTFESDDNMSEKSNLTSVKEETNSMIKVESEEQDNNRDLSNFDETFNDEPDVPDSSTNETDIMQKESQPAVINDILAYPHFKINYTDAGNKEYVCCINGKDNHYKTTLLISMKKHVQTKHLEKWDGYCFVCKVIVTPQGVHLFKDCFRHFLDQHMDNFPVMEKVVSEVAMDEQLTVPSNEILAEKTSSPKAYINVRALSELMSSAIDTDPVEERTLPKIQSVVSLGSASVEQSLPSPNYPMRAEVQQTKEYNYEETQAEVMSKKHRVILETMMSRSKLIQVFKCAGYYCSFTTNSAEDALLHVSTHQRVGGENALNCAYCDFDSSRNAIDLVSHVFNEHGHCQYVCVHCFYRAASSQLVKAHITRVHGEKVEMGSILRSMTVPSSAKDDSKDMLSRDVAVSRFVCGHGDRDTEETCKFRTYTTGKFIEHLEQRHGSAASHRCSLCQYDTAYPTNLVLHMRSHGLKLYQCTWCVYGADSEGELLAHASSKHPSKQPGAYIRIITNKVGSSELRVLPLAHLNKSNVPTEDVIPDVINENPVREAERSVELEKLIGHTNQMIESMTTAATNVTRASESDVEKCHESTVSDDSAVLSKNKESLEINTVLHTAQTESSLETLPQDLNVSEQIIPALKTEPLDKAPVKEPAQISEVISIDSDDDSDIDLSDDDVSSNRNSKVSEKSEIKFNIVPRQQLFKCSKCRAIVKNNSGYNRHIGSCYPNAADTIPCPHCSFKASNKLLLIAHLTSKHSMNPYVCGICQQRKASLLAVKKHLKAVHGVNKIIIASEFESGGNIIQYKVYEDKSKAPKRKLSVPATNSGAPTAKLKRYGPQDIDQLPINPILDGLVYCSLCEFNTKVRINMVRHLQMHAEQQPVPQTAPVNPVPHLETNEKHFDKMVNLASSSIVTRSLDKPTKPESQPPVTLTIPPEAATRYPKYVPERQRHTCGAKGCSYISVDEAMLRRHWETLHAGTVDFHCVHCPPYQYLDTSKPLTASRIVAHLKMHDSQLYACSSCLYYHYKRQVLEKHVAEVHKSGQVMIVREENMGKSTCGPSQQTMAAPTMDLKPWQCGLCKFKSMLRPDVVEHCAKMHQSKMQYKCAYCAFRTSTLENVTRHQLLSHTDRPAEVFYFYYREGSIPDEDDGTPRWVKQKQKSGLPEIIKTESMSPQQSLISITEPKPAENVVTIPVEVDLNLVKKEVNDTETIVVEESPEDLCKKFGEYCDPNGLRYKCPLCKVVMEDTRDAMQSHLYEELKYRKWACNLCSYKAFHKKGFDDHMFGEHRQQGAPLELPVDIKVETWVANLLDHQTEIIDKQKENLSKQAIKTPAVASTSKAPEKPVENTDPNSYNLKDLVMAFGELGTPVNKNFCCPKCQCTIKDETEMQNHLEAELNKIRWCCANCSSKFQTYHEAQYHCKSVHASRPVEAIRNPAMRSAWVAAVTRLQKFSMHTVPVQPTPHPETMETDSEHSETTDNSLLVVRYEEQLPSTEPKADNFDPVEGSCSAKQKAVVKRGKQALAYDSDDEKLVIDIDTREPQAAKKVELSCHYCSFSTKYKKTLQDHLLKHYNLKPFSCYYCIFNGYRQTVYRHLEMVHPDQLKYVTKTQMPSGPPPNLILSSSKRQQAMKKANVDDDTAKIICLICEKPFTEIEASSHVHDNVKPEFAKKGDVVVKCCICLKLALDVNSVQEHHNVCHQNLSLNYAFFRLQCDTREIHCCGHCDKRFKFVRDLKSHHNAVHNSLQLKYTSRAFVPGSVANDSYLGLESESDTVKRKAEEDVAQAPAPKRVAIKSTTKLPRPQAVAKKSTTKLPSNADISEEFSYYATASGSGSGSGVDLDKVTTIMPFCNTMVPFTYKKLSEIIKINPKVVVEDINTSDT